MARRDDTSCAGIGCAGFLILVVCVVVGSLLAQPVLIPDLLSVQTPPQKLSGAGQYLAVYGVSVVTAAVLAVFSGRSRRFVWWVVLGRTALYLGAGWSAMLWAEAQVDSPYWNIRGLAVSGATGVAAFVVHRGIRWWDAARANRAPGSRLGRRPARGEVWLAMVPYRESDQAAQHYCVVLRTRAGHAEVLQITSKNKDGRADHIRIPNAGWDHVSGRDHWVEIGVPPRPVPYPDFLKSRPQGRCHRATWRQLRASAPAGATGGRRRALLSRFTQGGA
ncbi:hypothetical protein [Streptomyces pristinaespiralis]|uniref:hypothetical protein n=1 Tax=Streptomyces pristinaespiralis TaxID=38300 RepID=UPI00383985D0